MSNIYSDTIAYIGRRGGKAWVKRFFSQHTDEDIAGFMIEQGATSRKESVVVNAVWAARNHFMCKGEALTKEQEREAWVVLVSFFNAMVCLNSMDSLGGRLSAQHGTYGHAYEGWMSTVQEFMVSTKDPEIDIVDWKNIAMCEQGTMSVTQMKRHLKINR